jgi:hypothetical protein
MRVKSITPADGSTGVPVESSVVIDFDDLADPATITAGTAFLVGPDTNVWVGGRLNWRELPVPDEDNNILNSPGYEGFVSGSIKVETVSGSASSDSGGGSFTRVTFTPEKPLYGEYDYTVIVVGGTPPGDDFLPITTRTVGTPVASVVGNGVISVEGHWYGNDDTLNVFITADGRLGTGEFSWYYNTAPATIYGPVTLTGVYEIDGLKIHFEQGDYISGDTYRIPLYKASYLDQTYKSSFTTAEFVKTAPTTAPTPVAGPFISLAGASAMFGPLVESGATSPKNGAFNVPVDTDMIVVEFTKEIDAASVTDETVKLLYENVENVTSGRVPVTLQVQNVNGRGRIILLL